MPTDIEKLYQSCREIMKQYPDIKIVTARQHPRAPGYRAPPPPPKGEIVFIDYITILK